MYGRGPKKDSSQGWGVMKRDLRSLKKLSSLKKASSGSLRHQKMGKGETMAAIVEVKVPDYVPEGVKIRGRISDLIFTADLTEENLLALEEDPNVKSLSLSERQRLIQ